MMVESNTRYLLSTMNYIIPYEKVLIYFLWYKSLAESFVNQATFQGYYYLWRLRPFRPCAVILKT